MVSCIVFSLSNIYNPWEVQVKHTYKSHSVHELQVCNSVSVSIPETLAASLLRCCTLNSGRFSSVQLLSHIRLFVTPWTAACQASLSIKNSWSLLKLMSIESVVPSNHFILCSPSPPAYNLSQHQGLFQWLSSSYQVAKVLEFQFQHQSLQWYSGLISFRLDWFDLPAVQGTLKSLLQHHSAKASILRT